LDDVTYFYLYAKHSYVGRMFVKAVGKPLEILAKLNELAGFPENEEIELFEVLIPMHHFLYHFPKFELAGFPIPGFFLDFCILYSLYQV
jgi:hypothetical protein